MIGRLSHQTDIPVVVFIVNCRPFFEITIRQPDIGSNAYRSTTGKYIFLEIGTARIVQFAKAQPDSFVIHHGSPAFEIGAIKIIADELKTADFVASESGRIYPGRLGTKDRGGRLIVKYTLRFRNSVGTGKRRQQQYTRDNDGKDPPGIISQIHLILSHRCFLFL